MKYLTRRELLKVAGMATLGAEFSAPVYAQDRLLTVRPRPYDGALRNPLMGFRRDLMPLPQLEQQEWVTLVRQYIKWHEIENNESDSLDKIREFCDAKWRGLDALNIKVTPRVYLHWSKDDEKYWPADLTTDDYDSPQFLKRLLRLIERLGTVWDNDPRVGFVQMGFIGKWGEHHSPDISPSTQKLMGDAFTAAFPHKKVMVRHPWDFTDYRFGIYWDSWAHIQQEAHANGIRTLGERWKTAPIGGETAYDWGRYREQPGDDPNDTLSDATHRRYLIDLIRDLHGNHLGWVANYDPKNEAARAGAAEVQKAFGYRFVIEEAQFPATVRAGRAFDFQFVVRNEGSTPLYADWPVQISFLNQQRRVVWQSTLTGNKTSTWLPGDKWDAATQKYRVAPLAYKVQARLVLPARLAPAKYFVALSILDPAGNRPAVQFATTQYWQGGFHILGSIGVGTKNVISTVEGVSFDDLAQDRSLRYIARV